MADYLTNTADLTSVADAIRTKGGTDAQLVYPAGFVSAIQAIQTGVAVQLIVKTRAGASVTAAKGSTSVSGTADTNGTCTLALSEAGEWVVTVSKSGDSQSKTMLIGTQEVELPMTNAAFAENTWERIVEVCQAGKVPNTWVVGDSKTMLIGETEYQIDIIGKNHDDLADGSGKAALTLQLHSCYAEKLKFNNTLSSGADTNAGGWESSLMRTTHLPAILALMPAEVQSGIREVSKKTTAGSKSRTIVTTTDKLFLLSEIEARGRVQWASSEEGAQYDYYEADSSRRVKTWNGSASAWWLRSPVLTSTGDICFVDYDGTSSYYGASNVYGVAFAFCL